MFFADSDCETYKTLMRDWCARAGVEIWAYCLMTNHVHLVAVPESEAALARAIGEAHRRYTAEINRREGWTGHLWQGRFASFAMDDAYALRAACHVELIPVAATMTRRAEEYAWSSARAHVAGRDDGLVRVAPLLERVEDWRAFLDSGDPADDFETKLAVHAAGGWPLGNDAFIGELERQTGRSMKPRPRGRPRKNQMGGEENAA